MITGPTGKSFGVFEGIGLFVGGALNDLDLLLDDQAAASLSKSSVPTASGSFKPFFTQISNFPAPGPGNGYDEPAPLGADTLNGSYATTAPNGTWSIYVRDFDSANQSGTIARGWTLEITTDAADPAPPADPDPTPTPPVVPPPADSAKPTTQISELTTKKGKRTAKLEFSGADDITAASALTFTCKLDDGAAPPCTSPTTYRRLAFGRHAVEVRATDAAGNIGDPATEIFKTKKKPKRH